MYIIEQRLPMLFLFLFLLIIGIYIYKKSHSKKKNGHGFILFRRNLYKLVTTKDRGTKSERVLISKLIKNGFKPTAVYHDLLVFLPNGKSRQIDIVVATDVGLLVIEVKDYTGWIFGKGYQERWTVVSGYGRNKNRFYNPFMQNQGHIKALRTLSPTFATIPMYSLIVFCGDCELKDVSYIPQDAYLATGGRFIEAIRSITSTYPKVEYKDKWEIANTLKKTVVQGSNKTNQSMHISEIQNMLGTNRRFE